MDSLLTENDRKEALFLAYVQAVAAGAGYVVAKMDFDRDGIDVEIKAGGDMSPALGVQLKATSGLRVLRDGNFSFDLKTLNYNHLRRVTQTPRILVVFKMPNDEKSWIDCSLEELRLRHCAYWRNFLGAPATNNEETVAISIENRNIFDIDCLKNLMQSSREGIL